MDRLLSTILIELDGLARHEGKAMAVIGITQQRSWVDSALFRPGRLHDSIYLTRPDHLTRFLILQDLLPKYKIDFSTPFLGKINTHGDLALFLAAETVGWSAAEIKAICPETVRITLCEAIEAGKIELAQGDIVLSQRHIQRALNSVKR